MKKFLLDERLLAQVILTIGDKSPALTSRLISLPRVPGQDRDPEPEDSIGTWLSEYCNVDTSYTAPYSDLWASWSAFCVTERIPTGSRNKTFPRALRSEGFYPTQNVGKARQRGFKGLRLKTDFEGL